MFGVIRGLYRGARRTPMTSKRGHNYYKGTGSGAMGRHTKRGGYLIDWNKVRTFVVPDLTDFTLSAYVSRKTIPPHGQGAFTSKEFFRSNEAKSA